MKTLKHIALILFLFTSAELLAQIPPNLHVEGEVTTNTLFNESFEGTMGSFTTAPDSDYGWFSTNSESYVGSNSAFTSLPSGGGSNTLESTIVIPSGSTGFLSFYYKVIANNNSWINASVNDPNNTLNPIALNTNGSWHQYSRILPEGSNILEITLSENYQYSGGSMYVDAVNVDVVSNYAVKITDGNEGIGKVLMSDASGNATWLDLNEAIDNYDVFDPLVINGASNYAVRIMNSGNEGIRIEGSGGDGIHINESNFTGIRINETNSDGIYIDEAAYDGLDIQYSGDDGVESTSNSGHGIYTGYNSGDGIYSTSNLGNAAWFNGIVFASVIQKGGGTFKIDHPLDPENKYMYHSFVESPDMMNIYNGNVVLDAKGEAEVVMEEWFDALNKDFRYQLTAIGAPGPNLYIAEEIVENKFKIAGGSANMKVSWTITGVRKDAFAEANRVEVEEDKPEEYKGYYLHAEAHGQPFERSIDFLKQKDDKAEKEEPKKEVNPVNQNGKPLMPESPSITPTIVPIPRR